MSQPTDLFNRLAQHWTDRAKPFLTTLDGRIVTYQDVDEGSARLAHALAEAGVAPGDRVAVQTEKSPEAVLLFLACLRVGAVYLPLNTAYTLSEIEYFLSDAEPTVVVVSPAKEAATAELCARLGVKHCLTLGTNSDGSLMARADSKPSTFAGVPRAADDIAAILYTSGTTGRSKGAMLTHENLASNAQALAEYWRYTSDDVLIHALPIFHVHGLFTATNITLWCNASMLFLAKFDADDIFTVMPRATTMMGVPTFYVRLIQDPRLNHEATKHMRLFVSGSAPLLAETHRTFTARTGHAILERYGMTETGMNTSNPYDGDRVPGAVGFPLPGISLRVTEPETGHELPQGEIGMIEVKGPNVFKGYWRMPEKTAAEFRPDGYFITGDLGRIDDNGYVHIVGRGKDLVISGGYNVYPKEIESEIDAIPGVLESAVIGVPHPDFGEGVTAVVVLENGAGLAEADIVGALKGRLATFKMPKRVMFVDAFPRNTMGKVQKNILRDTYGKLYS
ncbi:MAG: malonyl-CoA synthase [Hyphomicrobiaceae bacterium]|nr:malonyl-CoA synthase [Hyphomicrobiaceae bacterium]